MCPRCQYKVNHILATRGEELKSLGKSLGLRDNRCSCQATNMKELAHNLRPNNQASANALGGNYKAPLIGDSVFGNMLYDEDLQMTLFSQSLLTDMNCVAANDNGRECVARFPDVNVDITFAYIEGVMAADLMPLKQAYERKQTNATLRHATPTFRRNWTNP